MAKSHVAHDSDFPQNKQKKSCEKSDKQWIYFTAFAVNRNVFGIEKQIWFKRIGRIEKVCRENQYFTWSK